jgi:hypothetical protein
MGQKEMHWFWTAVTALIAGGVAWLLMQPSGPLLAPGSRSLVFFRALLFAVSVAGAVVVGRQRFRAPSPDEEETHPVRSYGLAFGVLALGVVAIQPARSSLYWWAWAAIVVAGPWLVRFVLRPLEKTPRVWLIRLATWGAMVAVVFCFLGLFSPGNWHHVVLEDDYSIVYYNTLKDLESLGAGGLYGWDHQVEGGRSLFLSLRTLAPLVWPFTPLGQEFAFHLVYLGAWIAFPLLVGLALAGALRSHTRPVASSAFGWGVFAGALFLLAYRASLFRFGMIYSMVAVDFLLLQLILLDRLLRGGRAAAVVLGLVVGVGVYVHAAQQAMAVLFLAVITLYRLRVTRRLLPWSLFLSTGLVAVGVAIPYLAQFWIYRSCLTAHYLMGLSPVLATFQEIGPVRTAWVLVSQVLWEFPGSFRILVLCAPLFALTVRSRARLGGLTWIGALVIAGLFLVWIPAWGYSLLRWQFLLPAVLAVVAAEALRTSRGWGRGAILVGLTLFLTTMPGVDWPPRPLYSARSLAEVEGELTRTVQKLPGHRVLFENAAGQSPLRDLNRAYDVYPGREVQRAGPLALASGRDLMAHAGWDPYPYHGLRDAFVVNGAWQGSPLEEVDDRDFENLLRRYGVEGIVVWSPGARAYFRGRPDRYEVLGQVAARVEPVAVPEYQVFRFRQPDGRAVRVANGQGEVLDRGPFHYEVAVQGALAGDPVSISVRYLPGWRARVIAGEELPVENVDGLLSVRAPREGSFSVRFTFHRRAGDLGVGFCLVLLGSVMAWGARRRKGDGMAEGQPR